MRQGLARSGGGGDQCISAGHHRAPTSFLGGRGGNEMLSKPLSQVGVKTPRQGTVRRDGGLHLEPSAEEEQGGLVIGPVDAATRIRPRKASNLRRPIPRMIRISSTLRKGGFLARNSRIRRASTGPTPGSDSSSLRPAELMSSRSPSSIRFEGDGCRPCRAGAADSCPGLGGLPKAAFEDHQPGQAESKGRTAIPTGLPHYLSLFFRSARSRRISPSPFPTHVEHKKSIPQDTEPCQTKPNGM